MRSIASGHCMSFGPRLWRPASSNCAQGNKLRLERAVIAHLKFELLLLLFELGALGAFFVQLSQQLLALIAKLSVGRSGTSTVFAIARENQTRA